MSEYVNYDGLKRYDELIKNVISVKTLIGSCSTAAGTAAKVVSVESGFKLLKGVRIGVKFTNSNTASNVTLNVNNTGAKSIYYNNAVYTETSNMICGYANRYVFYVYDGTNWVWDGYSNHDNTNTWKAANASQEGYVPKSTANKILRSDANGALYWGNDNNTTYSSKAAEANGTDVSLVTTGEKAIWNAKTSNTGTITGIKMNGVSKGTSGVVDLGTVITAHQDISGKADKTTTVNGHALSGNVSVTKSDVGLGNVTNDSQVKRSEMGAASGVATLDSAGKIPSSQLPSYVDDVLEYDTKSAFPKTGEGGKIYVDKSNNTTWRWSGSAYTLIKGDLVIGTTTDTAADGKVVNDHINNTSNPHGVTKSQVGLGSVVNTGDSATPVSGGTTKFTTGGAYTELAKKVDKVSGKGLSTNDYTTDEKNKLSGIASGAEVNQNAFSNVGVKVGNTTTTVAADAKTDTVTLIQGSNVTLTPDATNDTITIAATDTKYTAATAAPGKVASASAQGSSTNYARQDHTHGIDLATGDSNGQVKIAGTNVSVKGLGSAAYTASSAYAAASHTHSADNIVGGYLNIHPENNPTLIPFINNDIAYLTKRGGSVTIKYDGTAQSVSLDNCFDASPSYFSMNPSNITTIIVELTLHRVFAWPNTIYIDFGSASWRAVNVKIEVMNSNYTSDTWTQKYNTTSNTLGHCYASVSHTPVGAPNAGGGFNKIRFTLSRWATSNNLRIAQIGVYNYGSSGLRETFLPKDGGDIYGNIQFYRNNEQKLKLYTDNEGGNIRIVSPSEYKDEDNNQRFWEIDSYDGNLRFYTRNSGSVKYIFGTDGSLNVTKINGVTVGSSPKFTDTTYSSKSAASGGTDVSLVTTGEKYTWNSKTSNTGTVTKITAGTGLTGGDITTTGTIALATSGVTAGTYKRVTVDAYGRVTSGDNTDSDTKNTTGTTNKTGTKMFLAAATELSTNPVTYSNSNCYIGTDNCLYSGGSKVLTSETYTGTVTGVKVGTTSYSPSSGIVTIPAYPTTLPASDVSAWAKASTKPSYSYSEINYNPTEITSAGGAVSINGTNPLLVITISAAVSGITFSAVPANGHSCHLIITAASDLSVAIAHGATMFTGYTSVCPEATDVSLDITAGGYVELDLLRVGTKIYVRGV